MRRKLRTILVGVLVATLTVDPPRKPVLFLPDGRVIVRKVGF